MNKILFFFSLILLFSASSFAETITIESVQPEGSHLGMRIAMRPVINEDFQSKLELNKRDFLLLNDENLIDLRVVQDKQTKINHLRLMVVYDTYINNVEKKGNVILYVQCPAMRTVSKHQKIKSVVKILDISEEAVTPGFYKFLTLDSSTRSLIDSKFGVSGKPNDWAETELMCALASLEYTRHQYMELFRPRTLERFGVIE